MRYRDVAEKLKTEIEAGTYREKLPSCREVAARYGVSYVTATRAVRALNDAGLVASSPGLGSRVVPPEKRPATAAGKAGFIMRTQGDLFSGFFAPLVSHLAKLGITAQAVDDEYHLGLLPAAERRARLGRCAAERFDTLIVDGDRLFPFNEFRDEVREYGQLNFVMMCDAEADFPEANRILCDFCKAGKIAAEHLLSHGVKRIAFLDFYELAEPRRRALGSTRSSHDQQMLDGIAAVYAEYGLSFEECCTVLREPVSGRKVPGLREFLVSGKAPGVIALGDCRAAALYEEAAELNLKIGKDVFAVGLFDTVWSEAFSPKLTTINVGEEEIAALTAQAIEEKWRGVTRYAEPLLIVKGSSFKK